MVVHANVLSQAAHAHTEANSRVSACITLSHPAACISAIHKQGKCKINFQNSHSIFYNLHLSPPRNVIFVNLTSEEGLASNDFTTASGRETLPFIPGKSCDC